MMCAWCERSFSLEGWITKTFYMDEEWEFCSMNCYSEFIKMVRERGQKADAAKAAKAGGR